MEPVAMTESNPSIKQVIQLLKDRGLNAEYWHSGGGNFGIMVWLPDDKSLLWGAVDGIWAYDHMEADNDYIASGFTDIPESGFDPQILAESIHSSVKAVAPN
jgi:hypothetical protein